MNQDQQQLAIWRCYCARCTREITDETQCEHGESLCSVSSGNQIMYLVTPNMAQLFISRFLQEFNRERCEES